MAKSNILALAFTTIIATTSIQAQAFIPTDSFEIAGNLFQACTDDRYTACVAYLEGVADMLAANNYQHNNHQFCFPTNLDSRELAQLFIHTIRRNPELMEVQSVLTSYLDAFPCKRD